MPKAEAEAVRKMRELVRLQNKRRKLAAEIRQIDEDIRTTKRMLKQIMAAAVEKPIRDQDWHESGAASKVFDTPPAGKPTN